jgi:hypothetical protein
MQVIETALPDVKIVEPDFSGTSAAFSTRA